MATENSKNPTENLEAASSLVMLYNSPSTPMLMSGPPPAALYAAVPQFQLDSTRNERSVSGQTEGENTSLDNETKTSDIDSQDTFSLLVSEVEKNLPTASNLHGKLDISEDYSISGGNLSSSSSGRRQSSRISARINNRRGENGDAVQFLPRLRSQNKRRAASVSLSSPYAKRRCSSVDSDGAQSEPGMPMLSLMNVVSVGAYSREQRIELLRKYLEKRKRRKWDKRIKYAVRKKFADSRLRVKGRFISKENEEMLRMGLMLMM